MVTCSQFSTIISWWFYKTFANSISKHKFYFKLISVWCILETINHYRKAFVSGLFQAPGWKSGLPFWRRFASCTVSASATNDCTVSVLVLNQSVQKYKQTKTEALPPAHLFSVLFSSDFIPPFLWLWTIPHFPQTPPPSTPPPRHSVYMEIWGLGFL